MDTASDAATTQADPTTEPEADPAIERLDRIGTLLEEVVDDNTAVTTSMNQLVQSQRALSADLSRELGELRKDMSAGLVHRTLKDLCLQLIGPLGAMEAMLDRADFTDPEIVSGHVKSLVVTLHGVLNRMGAERITVDVGVEAFNPAKHRCVNVVGPQDSPFPDAPPRTVVRIVEDGYLLADRLLNPAVVEIMADSAPASASAE
ncbi:nucleotide exchange factor GrpE [Lentzea nigeriaca]|uniref:nucleotide exchange factor GrpE n=1 Tax=Lentzea nigeriaca TaxID=1128665 RepID=UPI001957C0AB|nr:nucleotide exchange factor GrpE [Lentzea nigeriaca]MBM7856258.1 molecular chaperone GrpE (heat shock protein) [Lentzea nigeriaca]